MTAKLQYRDELYEVRSGMTVRSALLKLDINPESVLVTRAGELITDDELVQNDDNLRLIPVISGGGVGNINQRP